MSAQRVLKREFRVAFSRKAQPVWFRLLKWVVIVTVCVLYWHKPYFWWGVAGIFVLALGLHLFWRWKTKAWTRPWGGWNDIQAGNDSGN